MSTPKPALIKPARLEGSRIYLRPLEHVDLPLIRRWSENEETRVLTGEIAPMSPADAEAFFRRTQQQDRLWYVIHTKPNDRPIGEVGLLRMVPEWRTTDLSIILGETDARRNGYGEEAVRLLLDVAFGPLQMHRVAVGVVGFNHAAINFYRKIGFKQEGIQRDGYVHEGHFHDFVMMSLLESEYR